MSQIRTKIFNYGDKCESEWPPMFGKGGSGTYYRDPKTGIFKKGYPPPKEVKYGQAPNIIQDTTTAYYHPAAEKWTESKKEIEYLDNITGTITTDKKIPPNPYNQKEAKKRRHQDIRESTRKAVAQIDAGTAPLTEETRAMCERQNEIVSNALNMDAFNVAGRKNNAKGKRFRRR